MTMLFLDLLEKSLDGASDLPGAALTVLASLQKALKWALLGTIDLWIQG